MSNNNNPNRQFYANEETGYSDPLGNCNDFNLLNFINSGEETPVDSPLMDPRFYHHPEQGTSRQMPQQRQQPVYYNPVVQIPQHLPYNQQQLKTSPGSEYQASNSSYSGASSNNQQSPINGQVNIVVFLKRIQSILDLTTRTSHPSTTTKTRQHTIHFGRHSTRKPTIRALPNRQ